MQSDNKKSIQSNMEGGSVISECVTNSKTIFAYNFKPEAIRIYLESIDYITQKQIRDNFINGLIIGITFFSSFAKNAVIFAATKKYVLDDVLNTDEMSVVQNIINGGYKRIVVYMRDFGHLKKSIVAMKSIYSTLETNSLIPPYLNDNICSYYLFPIFHFQRIYNFLIFYDDIYIEIHYISIILLYF